MATISIIIPIYNASRFLLECLDSVVNQTFKDLEVILVDDCSVDDSFVIAQNYINTYNGDIVFKILQHDHNRGASAAKNTGIAAASGEYISFIDSDDYVSPNMYSKLLSEMENNGNDVGFVASCCHIVRDGKITGELYKIREKYCIPPARFARDMLLKKAPHMNGGKLIKKELYSYVQYREGRTNEDLLFLLDVYPFIEKLNIATIVIPDKLYYYRMHDSSVVHTYKGFLKIAFADWHEILSNISNKHPELYDEFEIEYSLDVYRKTMEARPENSSTHVEYDFLHGLLRKIRLKTVWNGLNNKSLIAFLFLKYFPKLYNKIV